MEFRPSEFMADVRRMRPLVHHITNYVTVNDCANMCICAGGAPVMTDDEMDVEDMASISGSLVLNIGTLSQRTVRSMISSGRTANSKGIPIILDPVGAGATPFRTRTAGYIIDELHPAVIKGNAGEMGVLSGIGGDVKGVDSHGASGDMREIVRSIAERNGCIAVATGEKDYVSDGKDVMEMSNGDALMDSVSGTGCMLSSVVGCYIATCGPSIWSVAAAIASFNVAAEDAAKASGGPGTFKPAFLDAMYNLDGESLDARVRWSI